MKDERKIVYKDYGIADVLPDGTIELNKNLKNYPQLERSLIQHELKHSNTPGFTKQDFIHDLTTIDQFSLWQMFKFMCKNPSSWIVFFPIHYSFKQNRLSYDINALIIWACLIVVIILAVTVGWKA